MLGFGRETSVQLVASANPQPYVPDSPHELNTNDDSDPDFDDIFKRSGDVFSTFDRDYRIDAENKADNETKNSGQATGATRRFANDIMGKHGPTLQVMSDHNYEFTGDTAKEYQDKVAEWFKDMKLCRKGKIALRACLRRGAGAGRFHPVIGARERQLFPNPLAINFRLFDTRRLDSLDDKYLYTDINDPYLDGIKVDSYGLPDEYRIDTRNIREIRGDYHFSSGLTSNSRPVFEYVKAEHVAHIFLEEVPEQRRGFTLLASGILPSSLARKTAMSITKGIRKAAMLFGFIEQEALPDNAEDKDGNPLAEARAVPQTGFRLHDGLMKFLGGGQKFVSGDQKLPSNNTESFLKQITGWLGTAINMPSFMVTSDYSETSYTSGRLGAQGWDGTVAEGQELVEAELLSKALNLFHLRAPRVAGFLSDELIAVLSKGGKVSKKPPKHKWNFTTRPSIQPLITARANQVFLKTGQKTHADIMTDTDVNSAWACQAETYGITIDQWRRIMLLEVTGLKPDQLAIALGETATGEDGDSAGENLKFETLKGKLDAVGVGIRAGLITPQKEDEASFRKAADLPAMGTEVEFAWTEDEGFRRPITLKSRAEQEKELVPNESGEDDDGGGDEDSDDDGASE